LTGNSIVGSIPGTIELTVNSWEGFHSAESVDGTLAVDLRAPIVLSQALMGDMVARGSGGPAMTAKRAVELWRMDVTSGGPTTTRRIR
jgi:hypothetical protein